MRRRILVLGDGLLGSSIVDKTNWLSVSRKKDEIDFMKSGLRKIITKK